MRRLWVYFIAIVLVGAAAVAVWATTKDIKSHDDNSSAASVSTANDKKTAVKQACQIFTLADAKQLLGDTVKGGSSPVNNSSADFVVSTCTYTQDQGANAPVASRQSATLLFQSPKTPSAITANQREFGPLKPTNAQDVSGYGDQAYWDSDHGQLNILKNNVWYILSFGPSAPSSRTLDQTKQMANLIVNKL